MIGEWSPLMVDVAIEIACFDVQFSVGYRPIANVLPLDSIKIRIYGDARIE